MVAKTNRLEKIKTAEALASTLLRLGSSRMLKQLTNSRYRIRYGYVLPKKEKGNKTPRIASIFSH